MNIQQNENFSHKHDIKAMIRLHEFRIGSYIHTINS